MPQVAELPREKVRIAFVQRSPYTHQTGLTGSQGYATPLPRRISETAKPHYQPTRPDSPFVAADLRRFTERLNLLSRLQNNWDGHGADAPNTLAIQNAYRWVVSLSIDLFWSGERFPFPFVTASAVGEIVLEWWRKEKHLTIYIGKDVEAEFVQSWGTDIYKEMRDGFVATADQRNEIWYWLIG